jgi:hypothetical protein
MQKNENQKNRINEKNEKRGAYPSPWEKLYVKTLSCHDS